MQRWRRDNRTHGEITETPQILGHQPGEGCDFCDSLRMEQADEAELDAAIAEEVEEAEPDATIAEEVGEGEGALEGMCSAAQTETDDDDDDDALSGTTRYSDSETLRAIKEESIIGAYDARSTMTSTSTSRTLRNSVYHPSQQTKIIDPIYRERGDDEERDGEEGMRKEKARRASEWARSYQHLVGRRADLQTTLQLERFEEVEMGKVEVGAVGGWI